MLLFLVGTNDTASQNLGRIKEDYNVLGVPVRKANQSTDKCPLVAFQDENQECMHTHVCSLENTQEELKLHAQLESYDATGITEVW